MTNAQLEIIYNQNIGLSHGAALRGVYDAGWYAHAGVTPGADQAAAQSLPTTVVKLKKPDD